MRITYQPISDPIQRRSMIVDQNTEVCPRKCHPLPLSVSLFRAIAGGIGRGRLYHIRLSQYISQAVSRLIPNPGKSFGKIAVDQLF
jgi:hypothetical protein